MQLISSIVVKIYSSLANNQIIANFVQHSQFGTHLVHPLYSLPYCKIEFQSRAYTTLHIGFLPVANMADFYDWKWCRLPYVPSWVPEGPSRVQGIRTISGHATSWTDFPDHMWTWTNPSQICLHTSWRTNAHTFFLELCEVWVYSSKFSKIRQ